MALSHLSDTETCTLGGAGGPLSELCRDRLKQVARTAIAYELDRGAPMPLGLEEQPPGFRDPRATFVSLYLRGELQGCIGTLKAIRPLARDIVHNARAAAFEDPRGVNLKPEDVDNLEIQISILSEPEPIEFANEAELISKLRPGVDGLVVREGDLRGTLLPSVWEHLPDRREFLEHVKVKAGLPKRYWSPTIRVERYETETF